MSGLFITLEGGEGAGKTTIANAVIDKLSTLGIETLYTREPGGIKIAEKIREVILDRDHTEMDCRTEALLYAAARRQHLVEKVKPAMDVVLCYAIALWIVRLCIKVMLVALEWMKFVRLISSRLKGLCRI